MNWKLLAVLCGPMLLAGAEPPSTMTIGEWASGCSNVEGVEAENVGERDNPDAALDKAALEMCRMEMNQPNAAITYSIVYKQTFNDNSVTLIKGKLVPLANPKVVRWAIQCGKPTVAASSASTSGTC